MPDITYTKKVGKGELSLSAGPLAAAAAAAVNRYIRQPSAIIAARESPKKLENVWEEEESMC